MRKPVIEAIEANKEKDAAAIADAVLSALRDLKREDAAPALAVAEAAELDIVADEYIAMHKAVLDAALNGKS